MEKYTKTVKQTIVQKTTNPILDILFTEIQPSIKEVQLKLNNVSGNIIDNNTEKIWNVFKLCNDQIRKCALIVIDVVNYNKKFRAHQQEILQCTLERLSCCYQKLNSINNYLDGKDDFGSEETIFPNTMYFVNWIDQTFEVLEKLSNIIYRNNCDTNSEEYNVWKNELVTCVSGIHTCIDELLLCAMTLCKYCLPSDQLIVKARCQVVLRETKALISDLIIGDVDSVFQATKETLKLPLKPSNINVLIDVLKDVLYVLETNTNTALLALLVHCFAYNQSPAKILMEHFSNESQDSCVCSNHEDCEYVKEFDLYNERLMQIGSFAISCSSDDQRVLNLRSGLASLEALDPHLVPATMLAPLSYNATFFTDIWMNEVENIKQNVFLIVDPSAFSQKAKQMMHQRLLEIMKDNAFDNNKTCSVINIGCIMKEFFDIYQTHEPDALQQQDKLLPLLKDLNKVQLECKVVNNILSSERDFCYPTKKECNDNATFEQLLKRLKLLYTIVNRISTLLGPKENDDQFLEEQSVVKNKTHTVNNNEFHTYVNSPKKTVNMTRSIFSRTTNIRCSTAKFPLAILTKNLKHRKDLSFSLKLDELCNDVSGIKMRNASILYNSPMKNRSSLRKAVLSRHCAKTPYAGENDVFEDDLEEDLVDDAMSLQITDVLNEINLITNTKHTLNLTYDGEEKSKSNVLNITVNNESMTKRVWNITVNNETCSSSLPSNVDTLERINDLNLVTSKISNLRTVEMETSL